MVGVSVQSFSESFKLYFEAIKKIIPLDGRDSEIPHNENYEDTIGIHETIDYEDNCMSIL